VDLDGDGDTDLLFGGRGAERALLNDGSARFTDDSAARLPASTDTTQDLAWGDLDGDGDADLAVGNEDGNRLLFNDGTGHFTDATAGRLPPASEETRNVDLGDVDRDGDLDLLFSNVNLGTGRSPRDRLLLNDGTGRFQDVSSAQLPPDSASTMDSDLVDVDADGDLDVVQALLQSVPSARVWLNDGAGRFADATATFIPTSVRGDFIEAEAADLNRDGKLDLFLGAFTGGRDRLLLAR
jgi:FG-GAP-like repeat